MKILFVEDNESIILGVAYLLREEGYEVFIARTMNTALEILKKEEFDLALLDVSLPDGNGFQLCKKIKEVSTSGEASIPIVFLTAKEEEENVVRGFDLGADDYIIKPFRNRELISRIKNALRKSKKENTVICCQGIKLDTQTGRVTKGEEDISLTKLEYRILYTMMSMPGKLFSREEILANIWDAAGNYVNDNTLSVNIKRIREKLGDKNGDIIKTVRGMGYRIEK
ncbi:MAG: response regulator transcription factor [Acetatifactor sp.]